jgi:predicted aspartyl protease
MSQLSIFKWFIAIHFLGFAALATSASPAEDLIEVNFTMVNDYIVVVPVTVNGAGPFKFVLDTGTSRSAVERKIADQLSLPRIAESHAVGVQESVLVSLVYSDSVSMGAATVRNLSLTVLPEAAGLPSGIRGILGEDFLEKFDVLIDNRHHRIELQPGSGPLADGLTGERLPVRLDGIMDGHPTIGRLIIACRAPELSRNEISLLLDSGINYLVLFGGPQSLGVGAAAQNYFVASTSKSSNSVVVSTKMIRQLRIGNKIVANVTAVAPPARPGTDTDGLLPTSFFNSIFISHSQKFVILDPSTKH